MVLASHCILTYYGFWLPNEQRGSWSDFVRSWELLLSYGKATKTDDRHSVAHRKYDRAHRQEATQSLKYDPVEFTGIQARAVARGFARAVEESGYQIPACSILPRHSHLVILRHERPVEQIIGHLKARAAQQLRSEGLHPFEEFRDACDRIPSAWTHRAWKVFLDSNADIVRSIDYVVNNPLKENKSMQAWPFVVPWVNKSLDTPRKRGR
jgi:REP element-mobilizing transposase RayT